ncbi:ribose-5-phosphate isomerase rki1, partial [Tilletia horrida]
MAPPAVIPITASDISTPLLAPTASVSAALHSSAGANASTSSSKQEEPLQLASLSGVEAAKRAAAYAAVDNHVRPEHEVIGIGSGSTVPYVVERIAQQGEGVNAKRWFVPTGFQSRELIIKA